MAERIEIIFVLFCVPPTRKSFKRARELQNFDYLSCTLHNLVTKEGILDAICVREKQRGSLSDVFIIIPERIKSYKM